MRLAVETFVCCFIIAAGMFLNVVYCVQYEGGLQRKAIPVGRSP